MRAERDDRPASPAHATGTVEFVALEEISADEVFRLRPDGDVSALATSMGRLGQLAPIEVRPAPACEGAGPRWQVVAGFRRLAAVRLLARERVLARIHRDLADHDAWGLALAEALLHEPLCGPELAALRDRLQAQGIAPWAAELIDEALVRAPVDPALRERFDEFLRGAATQPATEPPSMPVEEAAPAAAPEPAAPLPESPATAPAHGGEPQLGAAVPGPQPPAGEEIVEVTPEELVQEVTARLYALNQDLATAFEAWEDLPVDGRREVVDQLRYLAALLPMMEARE